MKDWRCHKRRTRGAAGQYEFPYMSPLAKLGSENSRSHLIDLWCEVRHDEREEGEALCAYFIAVFSGVWFTYFLLYAAGIFPELV